MTNRTLKDKAAKLQGINAEMARMQEQADKLKADITTELETRAVDELKAGSVLIRWKEVTNPDLTERLSGRRTAACMSSMRGLAPPRGLPLYRHRKRPHTPASQHRYKAAI